MPRSRTSPSRSRRASPDAPAGSGSTQLLLDAARLLASSLDLQTTLHQVTGLLVPRVGDACRIYLRAGQASNFREVASAGTALEPALADGVPSDKVIATLCRAGRPRLVARAQGAVRWYAVVPLVARQSALGAIWLAAGGSRAGYDPADHELGELLEILGGRAALALDNARLYSELREAHHRALRTAQLETRLAAARLDALRAQLNPHFLFNALNTIAMLVRRQANDDAMRGIVGLSQLLRQVLDRRATPEVRLGEELALVEHYLVIERLRYRDRLEVRLAVAADVLDAQVPSLLLQPLVENAVRHGIGPRSEPGLIELIGCREGDELRLEVRDSGPGFPEGAAPAGGTGLGLANTRERLQQLYGASHRLELGNAPSGGAVVTVVLPFKPASQKAS